MGSIDFANITLQACDKPTRISLSSSCSAFSLLISASSVCTSFTSTCNLFPRRQAPPSTRCALELSCEPPSEENLHACWLQPPCKYRTCMFSFPLAVCAFLAGGRVRFKTLAKAKRPKVQVMGHVLAPSLPPDQVEQLHSHLILLHCCFAQFHLHFAYPEHTLDCIPYKYLYIEGSLSSYLT